MTWNSFCPNMWNFILKSSRMTFWLNGIDHCIIILHLFVSFIFSYCLSPSPKFRSHIVLIVILPFFCGEPPATKKKVVFAIAQFCPPFWSYFPQPAVPSLFGTSECCSYENLMPDDLRWNWGSDASIRECLQIQMKLRSSAHCSPPALRPGS